MACTASGTSSPRGASTPRIAAVVNFRRRWCSNGSGIHAAVAFWWDVPDGQSIALSIRLGWIWIAIFLGSLFFAKWRALWLLILAPFALYWPAMWIFVAHACDLLGRC